MTPTEFSVALSAILLRPISSAAECRARAAELAELLLSAPERERAELEVDIAWLERRVARLEGEEAGRLFRARELAYEAAHREAR